MAYHTRIAQATGVDVDATRAAMRFTNMMGDAAIHGSFETAIELYDTETTCALHGDPKHIELALTNVAGKLHGVVTAIEIAGLTFGNQAVHEEARDARRALDASGDY